MGAGAIEELERVALRTTVRAFERGDAARWEAFVDSCPDATFFHRLGWREIIESVFRHRTHYLVAERGARDRGHPMYESFFGLSGKPFQLNPDPSFFYGSRGHKRAFAYLEYGLYQSEGFIVITGEIGAGKTTIVRSLLEQLDSSKVVAVQLVSTQLEADDMLRSVGAAFGLPVRSVDKAVLLASLEAFLCQLAVDKKRALLVVDEAQNLPPGAVEELRMLSNFQLGDQALLQSFLVGQPELRAMMQSPQMQQLRQRVIASYHLGPLDKSETQSYIEHRLKHVNWNDDPGSSPRASISSTR